VYIDPVKEFGGRLLEVEKPARYTGGEIGILAKKDAVLKTLIAFPDLYEIGMGNQALRIIYNRMNGMQDISCDRAFAPAVDFEKLLREMNIPLYGLDTGISLASLDMLMFSIGYELGLNGVLTMLDVSGIPLRCEERKDNHPLVIAGGPAVSNPLPFSQFIDAFWIGEAEAGFFELAEKLARMKKRGEGRAALFEEISRHQNVWVKGKEKARRAFYSGFSDDGASSVFPVPSMKIIQHHGAVEIMRGCPNGCRFCHAGFWYRPARLKKKEIIAAQVRQMVTDGGWQEISLSSLSSGDYAGIAELVENLNRQFSGGRVSFQLPSLKVSGFSLDLLEKISVTRKSSLTFAAETPRDAWQMMVNKEVTRNSVVAILEEAKRRGWTKAKFYFMIGLPVSCEEGSEEEEIVSFIIDVAKRTRMRFNINVGIFVPKPHTPYQWARQIDGESAEKKLKFIRLKLKPFGHKVSVSDALISRIEGLLSRGDERAGLLCEQAFLGGSRLDAWDEYINREKWLQLLEENPELTDFISEAKYKPLPWEVIDPCVTREYLLSELEKSNNAQLTPSCREKCGLCGVCGKEEENKPRSFTEALPVHSCAPNSSFVNYDNDKVNNIPRSKSDPSIYRILFSFSKDGSAVFHGHLSLIEIFSMSFRRADIPVLYTQGFNPLAKIEFASPLTTGVSAECEIAAADFPDHFSTEIFTQNMNRSLPQGIRVVRAEGFLIKSGMKKHSLASLLWGFAYSSIEKTDYVNASMEKVYRQNRLEKDRLTLFSLKRGEVLAKNITEESGETEWASFFDVYRSLY
jgi:radical SAM-linked protein